MQLLSHLIALFSLSAAALAIPLEERAKLHPLGIDVTSPVDWPLAISEGVQFAYFRATEGTSAVDSSFFDNYVEAQNHGIIRGAYHVGLPTSTSSGATQANYFIDHGGGWTRDGSTLPGAVRFSGGCGDLNAAHMVSWIKSFSNTYHERTSRYPGKLLPLVIYTTTQWWSDCTHSSTAFGSTNPLWIISTVTGDIGPLPAGWNFATFWQWTTFSDFGDEDYYLGSAGLHNFASD